MRAPPADRAAGQDCLAGPRVALRPVAPEDLRPLWALATDPRTRQRWRWRGHTPTLEEFGRSISAGVLSQFVVVRVPRLEPIGHLTAYAADLSDGYAYVALLMAPEVQGTGMGAEAMVVFARHLFASWNLRKLYLEVPEFNLAAFASILRRLAVEEGRLRQHRFWDGRFHDQVVLAVYRERFSEWLARSPMAGAA